MHYLNTVSSSLFHLSPLATIWTSSMAESSLIRLLLHLPIIYLSLAMLEALWNSRQIVLYILFSCGVSGLVLTVVRSMGGMVMSTRPSVACGSVGLVLTVVIGVRHAFPLKEILNLGKIFPASLQVLLPARGIMQARHLAFIILTTELVGAVLFPSWFTEWPLGIISYFSAWFYLRYLMHFPYANLRGDHSTEFNLALLFPKFFRPILDKIFSLIYSIICKLTNVFELRTVDKSGLYSPADTAAANAVMDSLERSKFDDKKTKALKFLDDNIAALIGRKDENVVQRLVESPRRIGGLTADEIAEV
jgi:hypothetical protein